MRTMTVPVSRPRVYLIDFEVAIGFPAECPIAQCVCTGCPLGGSFSQPEMYSRPLAPEMTTGEPYIPFKTDVWQLGTSFNDCRVGYFLCTSDPRFHFSNLTDEDRRYRSRSRRDD